MRIAIERDLQAFSTGLSYSIMRYLEKEYKNKFEELEVLQANTLNTSNIIKT